MKPKSNTATSDTKPDTLKTVAIRLAPSKHTSLKDKCAALDVGIQELFDQMIDLFLDGSIQLKKACYVPSEMADALGLAIRDPQMYANLMKVLQAKKGS